MRTKTPTCPGCGANAVELQDASTGRHHCQRCGWLCRVDANGTATSWLNLATAGKTKAKRHRSNSADEPHSLFEKE